MTAVQGGEAAAAEEACGNTRPAPAGRLRDNASWWRLCNKGGSRLKTEATTAALGQVLVEAVE